MRRKVFLVAGWAPGLALVVVALIALCGGFGGVFWGGRALFNGRDLDGWRASGTELFYVDADGNLVLESGPDAQYGFLSTVEEFANFDCRFEFNELSNGNSGFFFRSVLPESTDPCWQVEIAPRGLWTGGIYESYGRGWLSQPTEEHLVEGWNRMRVRVEGDRARVWLNGVLVTDLTDGALSAGRGTGNIVLQIHDGGGIKVAFRKIRLKEL